MKYQELFNYLANNLGCIAVESEMQEIISIVKKSLWIEVDKDNLPNHKVISLNSNGDSLVGFLRLAGGWVECHFDGEIVCDITHYMEIPEI